LLRFWQALAFGYFEALLHHGDHSKIAAQIARLKSLNNLLYAAGYDEYMFEAFVDETIGLLERTAASIPCQDDGAALLASFNDDSIAGAIITHFRVSLSFIRYSHSERLSPDNKCSS
jgi:ubiquitin thioesterase protein OTUB1